MKTFGRSLALGFLLAALVLCGVGAVAMRSAYLMENAADGVTQSHQGLRILAELLNDVAEAEAAQRGFMLTKDPVYLTALERSVAEINSEMAEIRATPAWRSHTADLDNTEKDIAALLALFRERIADRQTMTLEEVTRSPKVNQVRHRMERLRERFNNMEIAEVEHLTARSAEMGQTTRRVKGVGLVGTALGLLIVVATGLVLQRLLMQMVGASAVDVAARARALEASSLKQAGATKQTSSAAVELTATMHEVQAAAHQIAQRSTEVEGMAEASTRAAQAGSHAMARAREATVGLSQQIDKVVTQMTTLGKEVQGAATVLGAIEELAERTNILAINATIEAYGAGDAGERFRVVADEIRRLAEKVRADAVDIGRQLDSIRNVSNATIMSTEAGAKAVAANSSLFSEAEAMFALISERVAASDIASKEIKMATHQQSSAGRQLEVALSDVGRATADAEQVAQSNLETAAALSKTAQRLSAFVASPTRWPTARPAPASPPAAPRR